MRRFGHIFLILLLLAPALALPRAAAAGPGLSALAHLEGGGVSLEERHARVELTIAMSQAVPWRIFTLDNPRRVVLDFSELDWTGADADALAAGVGRVSGMALGTYRPGWSRMVMELDRPMAVAKAVMDTGPDGAVVHIRLTDSDAASFAAAAGAPPSALFGAAELPPVHPRAPPGTGPLRVVIDPGHGGIDPGAERDGVREKDITLAFARELKEVLLRAGNIAVTLTRDDDEFVPLETRVTIARRAGADVFLSIHADALAQGRAHGATVYTLAASASDAASEKLAERHDRSDLLAGVDLSRADDSVAKVLMDLARTETRPRSEALARALVEGIFSATGATYKSPHLHAAFSVLKAPDIPSALIELGFLSSKSDRANLTDPGWRQQAALGVRDALLYWAAEDAATAARLRK